MRNGLIGGLIGGLVGGIVAWLALTYLVQLNADPELHALRAQVEQLAGGFTGLQGDHQALAQLSGRVQALEQAPSTADGDLAARVEALERAGAAGSDQAQAGPARAALEARLGALEHSVSAIEGSAASADLDELRSRLAGLEGQLASLSTDLAGAGDARAGDEASLEALQTRLGALERRLPEAGAVAGRIDALSARVDALEPTKAGLTQLTGDLRSVKDRLDGLAGQVEALHGDVEGLQTRIEQTQSQVKTAADRRALAAALALITSQIDAALSQGQAYEAPLRSLSPLGDQDDVVRQAAAELAPNAAGGVPSLAALRQSFTAVAGEIVQRERAPEGDSLIDQAASKLLRLVTVRPVGANVEGEGAAARVARAEADLGQGELAAAVAELEALKGPAAEAAADWLAEARTRLQATAALARLRAHTTDLLTPSD